MLHAPSHRQDNIYYSLCFTSRGAMVGITHFGGMKSIFQTSGSIVLIGGHEFQQVFSDAHCRDVCVKRTCGFRFIQIANHHTFLFLIFTH